MSYKTEAFKTELTYILNPAYRTFAESAIESLPDYFFKVAASSTGKYHPSYVLGDGGLLRHTKAAVGIAVELFRMESLKYSDDEKDLIIISLILHDGFKHGETEERYTRADHPVVCKQQIETNEKLHSLIDENSLQTIVSNIETHMGFFNKDYKTGKEILPTPKTKMQHLTHLCDYLASRKCLEFNFDIAMTRGE